MWRVMSPNNKVLAKGLEWTIKPDGLSGPD